jgi:hypothetical protein
LLTFEEAGVDQGQLVRVIAYVVPALVACGFFLFVLIEFRLDEKRRRKNAVVASVKREEPPGRTANAHERNQRAGPAPKNRITWKIDEQLDSPKYLEDRGGK